MRVLGIETSCDETAVAVVEDGRRVLSNVVASQVELHARYGGIVPEVASRQHILSIVPIYQEALQKAGVNQQGLDAVAVTMGPGLAGALLVGANFAKGLAFAQGLPFLGVNHLEGHIYAAWLEDIPDPAVDPGFPLLCLITSGGHTDLILMRSHGDYLLLGRTRDDAAGEAFDKAARVLGLGFPGGPEIQRVAAAASKGEPLPRPMLRETLDFSFSGLKTALLRRAQEQQVYPPSGEKPPASRVAGLAAGFQEAVVDVLVEKTLEAARLHQARGLLIGGGVAANALLRQQFRARSPLPVLIPRPGLCTDNGA
ncbi:MAG: tRNA (adenosine(37)-N6)-threonylcarbamoyltransferase complex transferase subunit TsaD, partial [Chloroflexi bacterium]|nr:tRNA (adenosine(37)-N6)-threonylcarbamoyltransferase complex transferase subunit TsaD [Chloroflexota bacterium]